jgi:hypothetical protein
LNSVSTQCTLLKIWTQKYLRFSVKKNEEKKRKSKKKSIADLILSPTSPDFFEQPPPGFFYMPCLLPCARRGRLQLLLPAARSTSLHRAVKVCVSLLGFRPPSAAPQIPAPFQLCRAPGRLLLLCSAPLRLLARFLPWPARRGCPAPAASSSLSLSSFQAAPSLSRLCAARPGVLCSPWPCELQRRALLAELLQLAGALCRAPSPPSARALLLPLQLQLAARPASCCRELQPRFRLVAQLDSALCSSSPSPLRAGRLVCHGRVQFPARPGWSRRRSRLSPFAFVEVARLCPVRVLLAFASRA